MAWLTEPEGPGRGPGGVSLCGDVRGVLRGVQGCDVCPPASRASLLLRILNEKNVISYLITIQSKLFFFSSSMYK